MRRDDLDGRSRRNVVGKSVAVVGLGILDGPTGVCSYKLKCNSLINNTYLMDESTRARESCTASEPNELDEPEPISSSTHTVGLLSEYGVMVVEGFRSGTEISGSIILSVPRGECES